MMCFNPDTRTSNPVLCICYYAFQVDGADQAIHPGWGPRTADTAQDDRISGAAAYKIYAATFASRRSRSWWGSRDAFDSPAFSGKMVRIVILNRNNDSLQVNYR